MGAHSHKSATHKPVRAAKKCWLGFGTLTVLFVAAVVGILFRLQPIEAELGDMAQARARAHVAQALEVNAGDYALGIWQFLATTDRAARQRIADATVHARTAAAEYGQLAVSERHRDMVTRLTTLWSEFEGFGQALVAKAESQPNLAGALQSRNEGEPGPASDEDVRRFDEARVRLERFLDDELQRDGEDDYRAGREATVRQGRNIEEFALITLLVGTGVALLTSATVGRAVTKSERQGEDSRELLRVTLASIGEGVITTDIEGRVTYINRVAEALTGWTNDQSRGVALPQVFHILNEETREPAESQAIRALREGRAVSLADHTLLVGKDGTERPIEDSAAPIHDETGAVVGGVVIFRDTTQRREAEQAVRDSERRLRSVLDSMPQKISTSTPSGDWAYLNPQWTEYTGLSLEQIREWGWRQVIHPDDVDENLRVWQDSTRTGEAFQFEHRIRRADGEYCWHISRALPVRDAAGQIVMWVGSNTDIHQQRQTADVLRQLTAELSEADRRKDEFLAMLAHELRNPLAPIRNAVEIVRRSGANESTVDKATDVMRRQLGHMVRLIDDLLDVSRVSQGKIELRKGPVELASIVHQAVEASRALMEHGGLHFTVGLLPDPIYVHADATRMAQVIGNLLSNAAKFTPQGGDVSLTLGRDDGHAVIRVRDTGIGIAPDHLRHVFDMFMQADTTLERTKSGLGIGLTLAKRLVELHDGTIEARSDGLDRGTELVVRVPVVEPPVARPSSQSPAGQKTAASRRVLVVDDNHDSTESLEMLLKLSGHDVRVAHDGVDAINVAAAFQPDVVLLDIGLPKLNGYEAARRIRELPSGRRLKLVALTGWGQDTDRQRSAESGFDLHLVKPVDHDVLLKLIADV